MYTLEGPEEEFIYEPKNGEQEKRGTPEMKDERNFDVAFYLILCAIVFLVSMFTSSMASRGRDHIMMQKLDSLSQKVDSLQWELNNPDRW